MAHSALFVGIDVAKLFLEVATWPSSEQRRFANDEIGRKELLSYLRQLRPQAIGLEASGGYERNVVRSLLDAGLPAQLINPWRVRRFAQACGILAKNDAIDAVVIARFVATLPQRIVTRSAVVEALAELVTARRQLCDELTRVRNQAEHTRQPILATIARRRIASIRAEILLLDKTIAKAVADNPDLARKDKLLRSVPSVGPVFSHSLLALMPELGSMSNRQAASLLGVAPFDCDSGNFKGQRRIFGGRRALRDVAYMAALSACAYNPPIKIFADRLRCNAKKPKVVLTAVMRKLISILNAILKSGQPWACS